MEPKTRRIGTVATNRNDSTTINVRPSTSRDINDGPPTERGLNSSNDLTFYTISRLTLELRTEEQCLQFAISRGLLPTEKYCRRHRTRMQLDRSKSIFGTFKCKIGGSSACITSANGTWYEGIKISLVHVIYLTYCFANRIPYGFAIKEDIIRDAENSLSRDTVHEWYTFCKETVVEYVTGKETITTKIGGPGKVVQIYRSTFGKRQFNRCLNTMGNWILGLIEDGSEDLRLEVCTNDIIFEHVLVPLIKNHVAEGTTIHTDGWVAFNCLGQNGFTHVIVDDSVHDTLFEEIDGTYARRANTQWTAFKRYIKKENYFDLYDVVVEYLWRRDIEKYNKDPFDEILLCIKDVYSMSYLIPSRS